MPDEFDRPSGQDTANQTGSEMPQFTEYTQNNVSAQGVDVKPQGSAGAYAQHDVSPLTYESVQHNNNYSAQVTGVSAGGNYVYGNAYGSSGAGEGFGTSPYNRFLGDEEFIPDFSKMEKRRKRRGLRVALWIIIVLLLSLTAVVVAYIISGKNLGSEKKGDDRIPYNTVSGVSYAEEASLTDAPQVSADPDGPQISMQEASADVNVNTANAAFNNVSPSIVCITSYSGSDYTLSETGEGSGIIISDDGYIATNSHVVSDSTSTGVMVTLSDGTQYLGTIVGVDKKTDLAVLKIDAKELTVAEFSDSDNLYVGQDVYAIGNPGGSSFSNSLTKGTISALNRILSNSGYVKYIQTDAAINPGNSGGALINESGQVIGMNTSKLVATDYEGMSFAIPSNKVAEIINKLIKFGYVNDRGTLKISGTTCTLYESKLKNVPQGMVITAIETDSPLASTQASKKDIITAIDGKTIKTANEFIEELSNYKPGDTVTLTLFRAAVTSDGQSYTFDVNVVLIDDSSL